MGKARFGVLLVLALAFVMVFGPVASAAGQAELKADVLIGFVDKPGPAEQAIVRAAGGITKYTYNLIPTIAASVPEAAIEGLRRNPRVTHVNRDTLVYAIGQTLPWGVDRIDAEVVHGAGNKAEWVKVAILDTGIARHTDLNIAGGRNFTKGKSDDYNDKNGHGTHVAGIVAALDNATGVIGVAPAASLYAVKVLGNGGTGNWSDLIAGIEWSVNNGMQVANMSLGATSAPGDVKAACDAAYAAGLLLVAAAGNDSGGPVIYPAAYDSVIAVSATTDTDTLATFSSVGPEVELAAPGKGIYSTYKGDGYATLDGTSMASPHVAGVAALVVKAGITSNTEVRQRLQNTAEDLGPVGRDNSFGYGLVDAEKAVLGTTGGNNLTGVNKEPAVSITSPADGSAFDSGATIGFEGTASDPEDGDLTTNLVWTSSIDGQIGTGRSFSRTLSDGTHAITASVTDSGGKTSSASISIKVGVQATGTMASVKSIDYATSGGKNNGKDLLITVALVDDLGKVLGGASVSIALSRSEGGTWSGNGTTGTDGKVTFKLVNAPSGTYTTVMTNVTAPPLTWDGVTPVNSFTK